MGGLLIGMGQVLHIQDAGHGTTPDCPQARYAKGQIVTRRAARWLAGKPMVCLIIAVVPPGFPADYALADAAGTARPLVTGKPRRVVSYIVGFEGHLAPALLLERDILSATGETAEVCWTGTAKPSPTPPATPDTGAPRCP